MAEEGRRIDVDGLAFRVIESAGPAGSAAPTVVLVHGIGMSHRYLAKLQEVLAESTDVVSIDLPGFGGLPKPEVDVDVERMAAGIADVLTLLGRESTILVGHSMGAQWVVEAARQRPSLASMVVTIGPVTDERHRTLGAQARALGLDTLGERPSTNAIVFTDYIRCGIRWYLMQLRHMLGYRIEDRVRELRMPLLVIRGGSDPVAGRDWCRRLTDEAPVSRFVEVPHRPHVVQQSAPFAVASAILFHAADHWAVTAEDSGLARRTEPA